MDWKMSPERRTEWDAIQEKKRALTGNTAFLANLLTDSHTTLNWGTKVYGRLLDMERRGDIGSWRGPEATRVFREAFGKVWPGIDPASVDWDRLFNYWADLFDWASRWDYRRQLHPEADSRTDINARYPTEEEPPGS